MKALSSSIAGLRHAFRTTRPGAYTAARTYAKFQSKDFKRPPRSPKNPLESFPSSSPNKLLSIDELPSHLATQAKKWHQAAHVKQRLERFGIPSFDAVPALTAFRKALETEDVLTTLDYGPDMRSRICIDLSEEADKHRGAIDIVLSRLFFAWAAHPSSASTLEPILSSPILRSIRELFRCADLSNRPAVHGLTRFDPPRKIIMHVGPTNSGKTHNALRALAAAERGCYAGPLRLLAYEIFMRLNHGQIVPLGVDPAATEAEPDVTTNIEGGDAAAAVVRKVGEKKFVRECNLVTGEEQVVVSAEAKLMSCTVEMLPKNDLVDVAVVDEIQMLADPQRGASWTAAVLGARARELHLCGEETAVPLVQELLRNTGDEIIVNRYERLTPLETAPKSMMGKIKDVEKGDCVVAFSRSEIFQMKTRIEKETGLKCAVAYGGLPAELRNEQAKLFNDPDSGYDVIVGSDAIGMGLNLYVFSLLFLIFPLSSCIFVAKSNASSSLRHAKAMAKGVMM